MSQEQNMYINVAGRGGVFAAETGQLPGLWEHEGPSHGDAMVKYFKIYYIVFVRAGF
jgi:hypothetical protein